MGRLDGAETHDKPVQPKQDDKFENGLLAWKELKGKYEEMARDAEPDPEKETALPERIQMATLLRWAPHEGGLRDHLILNSDTYKTYASMRAAIENYLRSRRLWKGTVAAAPMDISGVKGKDGKPWWKGGKAKEGKGRDDKGKGKDAQGKEPWWEGGKGQGRKRQGA